MDALHMITSEIARRKGYDPIDLPPIYEAVDPDALESVIKSASDGTCTVMFSYNGYHVTVADDGSVEIGEDGKGSAPNTART